MNIAILFFLVLLNGLFAMSEIALVTARRSRLQRLAEDGDKASAIAMKLSDEPTQFLSTVQIGITAIGIFNGIVGEAALANPLSEWLQHMGLYSSVSSPLSTFLVVAVITYFSIVLGELVPKRIGQSNAESIARFMARPISLLARISRPFVYLLSWSTDTLLLMMGKRGANASDLTEEDIHAILEEGSEAGVIERREHEMVRNVFRLDERPIASLMTARSEIVYLDVNRPLDENMAILMTSNLSRFPVCRGGFQELLGLITAKQLLKQWMEGESIDLTASLEPCVYVPESLNGMALLQQFRDSGTQMVFLIDEYGEILGLITLQDLLEALTGEFKPCDPEDVWAVQREDGSWLIDGLVPIQELKDRLDLKMVPEEEKGRYHTLSGMIMWLIGRLPKTGDIVEWEGWRFEVVDLDGNRVDKILAGRIPIEEAPPASDIMPPEA